MKKSKIISALGQQEITVKELSIEELDRIFSSDSVPCTLELVFCDRVPVLAVELSSGLNRQDLQQFAPSALLPLWEAVEEVNPFFVAALNRLSSLVKGRPTGTSG